MKEVPRSVMRKVRENRRAQKLLLVFETNAPEEIHILSGKKDIERVEKEGTRETQVMKKRLRKERWIWKRNSDVRVTSKEGGLRQKQSASTRRG